VSLLESVADMLCSGYWRGFVFNEKTFSVDENKKMACCYFDPATTMTGDNDNRNFVTTTESVK